MSILIDENTNPQPGPTSRPLPDVQERVRRRESSASVKQAARDLRKRATNSERILWGVLRDRGLDGYKWRRQHPFGRFIVDFYSAELQLAIEIDGPVHDFQAEADKERQDILEGLGVRFLRLPTQIIEQDLAAALQAIRNALPSPAHRERGRG